MKMYRVLYGLAVATFPDVAGGLLIGHAAVKLTGEFTWWAYVAGVFFTLVPDVDILIQVYGLRRKLDVHHRDLTHKPLLVVGAALLASTIWPFYGLIAAAGLTWHYLDDSVGDHVGSGLKWLAPLWSGQVGFFQTRDGRRVLVKTWADHEIKDGPGLVEWLETTYLVLTFTSVRSWVSITLAAVSIAATW